jgi:hypothetical protein
MTFIASTLMPAVADSSTSPSESLVTCINLGSGRESISKTGSCLSTQATANWRLAKSDTALPTAPGSKQLIVCSNQESSAFAYRLIRKECPQHQVRSIYYRNASIPVAPVISIVEAYSDVSAAISLLSDSSGNPDAPIAYYTISISNGETRKVKSFTDLRFAIGGLKASTTYTFTVTSTNADGTSEASTPSKSVTTKEYVPPVVAIPASTPVALTCATGGSCALGDTGPGGGIIFYVANTPFACGPARSFSCTYLEAARSNWNNGGDARRTWAQASPVNYQNTAIFNSTAPETASATAIGWGYRNTRAIILQGNSNAATSAAALADSYSSTFSGAVIDDWFLPSKDELSQLYVRRAIVGGFVETEDTYYFSSSGSSFFTAWVLSYFDGWQGSGNKGDSFYLRPIRAF